ncbi:MAG: 50S ribosomal protein L11 methyltransferase [Bacillota bacterium]|nr:50S ribosomal protein L11 methyltransferase [Bacillota bacterium]
MSEPDPPTTWWELRLKAHSGAEEVTARLLGVAPSGWVEGGGGVYTVYLPDAQAAEWARSAVQELGAVELKAVSDAGWQAWRRSFRAHAVGERLWIYPAWEAPAAPVSAGPGLREIPVIIEPGLAFGTGEHPTTAACLRYLEKLVRGGEYVLDVGTGSGILAIGAAMLGAGRVVGLEVDPLACRSARANLARNPAAQGRVEIREGNAVRELPGQGRGDCADIVTANLTSALIRHLAPGLAGAVRPGGHLVASGIGRPAGAEATRSLEQAGFRTVGRTYEAGWVSLLARREG